MANEEKKSKKKNSSKIDDLSVNTENSADKLMTTNQGLKINDNNNSLKAGERGPTLLEDFILREKTTHFDHERIPERIVHARGSGAHGVFKLYDSQNKYTKAAFLNDKTVETPVFVRFSTVAGSRGSSDLARDVRGFAVKFYTSEGNYDLVGNNMPVFFIQDAMKFPDLVHAVKPEPHHEMPQAASAHDTFWDFISLMPESMHMVMWQMSDRSLPRSYRMMEGFGVHTFRLINANNESHFVKFIWKPLLGVHSIAWDEAQNISGKDPDFHRRDLWEAIETGNFPEWELCLQIIPEKDEFKFSFDLLDPTKLIPEELIPVIRVGKMTLNRNPDNFFAETEQIAFHPGHIVPGIDFSNDPLLQGRLFSYTDTQLSRLGGPNFHEIPINRPVCPMHNNQRDGHMRQTINSDKTNYHPNSISGGAPMQAKEAEGGFVSHAERIDAVKVRNRSKSFFDHFSQATMFFHSQSKAEQKHIVDAFTFELGKVEKVYIRERMLGLLTQVDKSLASKVADGLGLHLPKAPEKPMNHGVSADADMKDTEPIHVKPVIDKSEALSMEGTIKDTIKTRKVAFLVANGVNDDSVSIMKKALVAKGAIVKLISLKQGTITTEGGNKITVDGTFMTDASVLYDAVYIPAGKDNITALITEPDSIHFVNEAYKHCKVIATGVESADFLKETFIKEIEFKNLNMEDVGVIIDGNADKFIKCIAKHRFWNREDFRKVPA
ncbi:MAG: catalase [Candidatus Kapabacteria bacterium]|nr:catalase [Candidatus Kapabacteria bacterium]